MAVISNFRGSLKRKRGNQMIVHIEKTDSREKAESLIGKTVVWTTPSKNEKQIKGKITGAHGNNGAVKVVFETGMPGQAIGTEVKVE